MKKNNTAEKAVLGAEKITKALKESTEKSLRDIINETISNLIVEGVEDPENDSYDVQDVEPDETPEVSDVNAEEGGEEGAEAPEEGAAEEGSDELGSDEGAEGAEGDDADDEWSDLEQYKIGDDDYDFTGVDGDEILKVYNKLGDDDQIFVKKEDDGTYSVKDDETGAEFVIELNSDKLDAEDGADGEENVDIDAEVNGDDFGAEGDEDELSIDLNSDNEGVADDDEEIEIDLGDDEDDDELNEDLGYTDSYQKDVFKNNVSMKEPADGKTTNDWDNGAPKGSEKPWAGKGDSKPFEKTVNECGAACAAPVEGEEANLEENGGTISSIDAKHMKKGQIAQHRPNAPAYDVRKVDSPMNESVKKLYAKAKAIQAENKQYKESLEKIKKSLYEAAVLNVNLGKLVDLLVNETTTRDEKKAILGRFNNVKTISEGKTLYDTIKLELNESKKVSTPIVEKQFTASSNALNEAVIYSNDPSLDLMNRMDNLYKK
jgi:hypothetical protein